MAIQRTIKVTTTQHVLTDEPKVQQFPMRKWSIQVSMVGPDGKDMPANVFDKVTYKLHPTFANPTRGKFCVEKTFSICRIVVLCVLTLS